MNRPFGPIKALLAERDMSVWSLIASNVITMAFAITEHWSLISIMFIYWCQNIIIGFFNVLKILSARVTTKEQVTGYDNGIFAVKLFLAAFFIVHYGLFQYGYYSFLSPSLKKADMRYIYAAAIIFFVNHLFSFIYNFNNDRERTDIAKLMFYPYARIIPMHVTIIAGMFVMALARSSLGETIVLVIFLTLKTIADVKMHIAEHGFTASN